MRSAPPACCLFFLLGLLPLAVWSAEKKKPADDAPPVLLSKDGGDAKWLDAPPVMVSRDGAKPKWKNLGQLKQFAERGDPQACFELAERLLYGDEAPQDIKQAVLLLEKAGQGGIPNAWFRLGKIYHDGLTGAPDYERTLDYYTRAARAGVPEAQHNIGAMLVSARGVKRDLVEGLAWLMVATKSGAASQAEIQVRNRLAQRPADIRLAEDRAKELFANLADAPVRAVLKTAPAASVASGSLPVPPAPGMANPVEKLVIKAPVIDSPLPPKISPPSAPPIPLPPAKK